MGTDRIECFRKEGGGVSRVRNCQEYKRLLSQVHFPPGFLPAGQHHSQQRRWVTKKPWDGTPEGKKAR